MHINSDLEKLRKDWVEQGEKKINNINNRITILMPIYNGIKYIDESITSIKKQTYNNWELIIGINGHPPNSDIYKIANKYSSENIKVYDMINIKGKSQALNKMLEYCKNDWICLLDVDDIWLPEKLQSQISYMYKYDIIGTKCKYFGDSNEEPNIPVGDLSTFDFFEVNPIINSSCLVKKNLCNWCELVNSRVEDYELWLKLYCENKKFYNVDIIQVLHRIHKTSFYNNTNNNFVEDLKNNYKKYMINKLTSLPNVRCSEEYWHQRDITLGQAMNRAFRDTRVKALHWYKNDGGDGRIDGVKGWYQGAGGEIGTVENNDWDTIPIETMKKNIEVKKIVFNSETEPNNDVFDYNIYYPVKWFGPHNSNKNIKDLFPNTWNIIVCDYEICISNMLKYHYYINLDHRADRNKDTIKLLKYIGIEEPRRFSAIKQENGALGCSMSHLECLKLAKKNKYPYVAILEDDIELSSHTSKSLGKSGTSCNITEQDIQTRIKDVIDKKFDVLFLGGNNIGNYEKIDPNNNYIKINNCQAPHSYIVKEHYYDTLLQNIEESINLLSKTGSNHYCIDMYFKKLQKTDEWWFMTPPIFIQKADYSDIQKKHVNYINQLEIW